MLSGLMKSDPDIQINYDTDVELYTLRGTYTRVQAALKQLLDLQSIEVNDTGRPDARDSALSARKTRKPHTQESEDLSRKPNKQTEQRAIVPMSRTCDELKSGRRGDVRPQSFGLEDTSREKGAALQPLGPSTTSEEDILIVDADMFQYIQRNYSKEYQQILSQYGVSGVEMTNQGLTTLFLQVSAETGDKSRDGEFLKLVRKAISSFFEENEAKICRVTLSKSVLHSMRGLERAKGILSVKLPKLLLNEDDQNIYIIGSVEDVCKAKQFLMDQCNMGEKKTSPASLPNFPSHSPGSSGHTKEQRVTPSAFSTLDPSGGKTDEPPRPEEHERGRSEGARKYKLASRFKDSQVAMLASRPADLVIRGGLSSPSGSKCPGPVEGYDVLSETAKNAGERLSRASGHVPAEGNMYERGDAMPTAASLQKKTSVNSDLLDTRHKDLALPISTSPPPSAGSGSTLKRSSSFSGSPLQRSDVKSQESQEDPGKSTVRVRPRSSSITCQTQMDTMGGYSAELTVSLVMWQYIKEAYSARVDDLTSDVQMKETRSEGSSDMTVTLRGANQSKVSSCLLSLQKLVSLVSADFSVNQVRLSEMGITDPEDENLLACCAEVRCRFQKVTTQILKKSLFLLGPKRLCSQVSASLREVFSVDLTQGTKQQELRAQSTSNWNPSTHFQTNEDQQLWFTDSQGTPESQTSSADGAGGGPPRTTNSSNVQKTELVNGSVSQLSPRKEPVIREKVRLVDMAEMDRQKNSSNHGVQSKGRADEDTAPHVNEGTLLSTPKDRVRQRHTESGEPSGEPRPSQAGGPGCICVCGRSGKPMKKTKCGATLCSRCMDTVHIHCSACHQVQSTPRGVQGKMNYCKLHISLPGHNKDSAIKITYRIPDGIQEVRGLLQTPSPSQAISSSCTGKTTAISYFPVCILQCPITDVG